MRFRTSPKDLAALEADLAVCFAHAGDREPRGVADRGLRRELAAEMKAERFRGEAGEIVVWNVDGRYGSRRFLVVGLGKERAAAGQALRRGSAKAAREAAALSASRLAIRLPDVPGDALVEEARAAVEGVAAGAYRFDRYLHDPARRGPELRTVEIAADGPGAALRRGVALGQVVGRAVSLARDLVNEAPSRMTPQAMARAAKKEAAARGLRCRVLGAAELRKLGMHSLLSVARGSAEKPQVVHLSYVPQGARPKQRVVLVGKGVTFDSGGLNLKPTDSMLTMKCDMAGAAAVLAAMSTLGEIGCRVEVHGLLGLVENMTGAAAYKPGDILDTYAGKSIEVGNTDAEGRLVLCDLLAWAADKLEPAQIVDVATLTGACVVALGPLAAGLFARDEALRGAILDAAERGGEKLWPLPLYEEYLELLQKGPADLRNVGGRWGGAITAALFLGEFVPASVPWAHLDIAGPAFVESELGGIAPGATGAAVPTLARWLESL